MWTKRIWKCSRRNYCEFVFWCSYKSKNSRRKTSPSVVIQKLMESLLWSCLKPPGGFSEERKSYTDASLLLWMAALIAWIYCYLLVIYIFYIGWKGCSYQSANSVFAIMKRQYLSSFLAGRGILVSYVFVCFSINVQTHSCGFFCLFFFFPMKLHFLVF